jgi:hypothetical protein
MTTSLVRIFGTRWRPGFFRLGGLFALSGIGRVSPTSGVRSPVGRDRITPIPNTLEVRVPAGDT